MYCDNLRVDDIRRSVPESPFYLYSKRKIAANFNAYKRALKDLPHITCYSIKANNNLVVMKLLKTLGAGATLVSGNELQAAMAAGFDPARTIFNGNGKLPWELELAVENGVMINIDSGKDECEGGSQGIGMLHALPPSLLAATPCGWLWARVLRSSRGRRRACAELPVPIIPISSRSLLPPGSRHSPPSPHPSYTPMPSLPCYPVSLCIRVYMHVYH